MKLLLGLVIFTAGCATYQFGHGKRMLPGGYDRVSIPVFSNKSHEVGVESYFTSSLRTEFESSRLATVTSKSEAQVTLEGEIISVSFTPSVQFNSSSNELVGPNLRLGGTENTMPSDTVMSKEYLAQVSVKIIARKMSDNTVLWQGDFSGQKVYLAPLLGKPSLNDSNSIYNQRSRQDTVSRLAVEMMSEAHDRITENF
jgi:hypothetical protein